MKKLIIILMALIAYSTHVFADKVSFTASAPDAVVVGEQAVVYCNYTKSERFSGTINQRF